MAGQQHYQRQIHGQMIQAPQAVSVAAAPAERNGLMDLAGEAIKTAQSIFPTVAKMYGEARQGRAQNALLNVDAQMEEYKQEYYRTRRGVDALTAQEDFARKYDELAQAALKEYGGDEHDTYWSGLRRNLMAGQFHAIKEGGNYARQQGEHWQKSLDDAQIANIMKGVQADPDDLHWAPYQINEFANGLAARTGQDQTALIQKLQGDADELRVQTLMAQGRYQDIVNLLGGESEGQGANLSDNGISGGRAGIGKFDPNARIGYALSHHESGKAGIMAAGPDSKGSLSYGKWQLNDGSGSYREWLATIAKRDETGREIAAKLMPFAKLGAGGNKQAALAAYREMAGKYGDYMEATQYEYIHKTHYQAALDRIKSPALRQAIDGNRALQEMLFSTAVQHGGGGAARILNRAWKDGANLEDFVRAVYQARGNDFPSSSAQVQKAVRARYVDEVQEVLSILNGGAIPQAAGPRQGVPTGGGLVMDPMRKAHFFLQAQAALAKQNEVIRVLIDTQVKDYLAQCENGIVAECPIDAGTIAAAYGQQGLPKLNEIQARQQLAVGLSMLRQISGPEQDQILERFKPQAGSPNFAERDKTYKRLVQERDSIQKAWKDNPTSWLIQNDPATKAAYQKTFTQGGFTPENAANFIANLKGAASARGLEDVPILDEDTAQRFADGIMKAENPGQIARDIYETFGVYGHDVMKSVMPKCPSTIMLVCNTMKPHAAKLLLQAKQDKDFEKRMGELLKIQGADATEFRTRVVDTLSNFTDTLLGGGNWQLAIDIVEDTRLLALQYMSQGQKQRAAIDRAVNETVGDSYIICENRNSNLKFRLPKATKMDAARIESGARRLIQGMKATDVIVPDVTAFDKDINADTIQGMLHNQTYWLTNNDESGLVLYLGGNPLWDKQGKPLQRTWQEVLDASSSPAKIQMQFYGSPNY